MTTTLFDEIATVDQQVADFRRRFPKLVLGTGVPFIVAAVILVPFLPLAGKIVLGVLYLVWVLAMVSYLSRFKAVGERLIQVAEEHGLPVREAIAGAAMTPRRPRRGAWVVLALVSSVVWVAYILAVYPLLDPPLANAGLALVVLSFVGLQVAIWASRHPTRPAGGHGHG